eukprot:2275789-Rhodomonas_salina.1
MDALPVPAVLEAYLADAAAKSNVIPAWPLPTKPPAVILIRIVPPIPPPMKHVTVVSEIQALVSQIDCPRRPETLCRAEPNPPPVTVTEFAPVPARLVNKILAGTSIEYASLTDMALAPTDTAICKDAAMPLEV